MADPLNIRSGQAQSVDGTFGPRAYSSLAAGTAVQPQTPGKLLFVGDPSHANDNQLHFQDCDVAIRDAKIRDFWRGIRPQGGSLVLEDCAFENCAQPVMAGACFPCTLRRVTATKGNPRLMAPADNHPGDTSADHFLYVSFPKEDDEEMPPTTIEDCEGWDYPGCGAHFNGNDGSDGGAECFLYNVVIRNLRLFRMGSQGTHALQPDKTAKADVDGLLIVDPHVGPLAFYHNGDGPKWSCRDWKIRRFTFYCPNAATNIHVSQGTERIEFADGVIVMANDDLVRDADGASKPSYIPSFVRTTFFYHSLSQIPASVQAEKSNVFRPIAEALAVFSHAANGAPAEAYIPANPSVMGGWRPVAAPPPAPPPPPVVLPPPPGPSAAAAALAKADAAAAALIASLAEVRAAIV